MPITCVGDLAQRFSLGLPKQQSSLVPARAQLIGTNHLHGTLDGVFPINAVVLAQDKRIGEVVHLALSHPDDRMRIIAFFR